MKVPLRELPGERSFPLGTAFVSDLVSGHPMRRALGEEAGEAGAGSADIAFYVEGDNVFARGTMGAWVELACSRCLTSLRHNIAEPLSVTYLPQGKVPNEDGSDIEEGEDLSEAEDTFGYEGKELDVEPMLREKLLLSIPYAPLCTPECLGLCSQCGANLNTSECGCDRKVIDPRLAALKNIKV